MPRTITEDELMDKARELGTIGEATKWMKANGITLMPNPIPPADEELPPVSQTQGALSTMDDEEETGAEDAMGGLDLAALDFSNTDRTKLPGLLNTLYQQNLAAQQRADQSAKQLYEEGRKRIMEKYAGPSQAEQLFALSRAMLAPRKVPGFGGFMGNVMGAFGNMETAQRTAEQEREERLLALQQQYQQGQIQREAQRPKTALEMAKTLAALTKPATGSAYDTQRGIFVNRNNPRPTENTYTIPGTKRTLVQWQDGYWREELPGGTYRVFERAGNAFKEVEGNPNG